MKKATFIRVVEKNSLSDRENEQRLFKLNPPVETPGYEYDEFYINEYVIVSCVVLPGDYGIDTMVFPADENGNIISFTEIDRTDGDWDFEKVLINMGYYVENLKDKLDKILNE